MEHRLRSPSRTYSDMPETRRAHGSGRNHSQHSSAPTRSRIDPSVYAEARKNGIFLPSSEYLAELLLGKDSPEPSPERYSDSEPEPVEETPPPRLRREPEPVEETPPPRLRLRPRPRPAPFTPTPTVDAAAASGKSDNPTPGSSGGTTCRREGLRQRTPKVNPQQQKAAVRPSTTVKTRRSKRLLNAKASANDTPAETSGATTADPKNCNDIEVIVVEDSDSDSQSSADSSRNRSFFKDSRLPYSAAEDEEILKFVLTGNNVEKTSSILLWKELEAVKGTPRRTYQSLKNRFLRNIKPYILTRFKHLLTPESLNMLKRKFPDLKISDNKKYAPVRPYEKRVVCVNPSTEGSSRPAATDTHFNLNNFTSTADPDESETDKDRENREGPSTSSGPVNLPEAEPNNTPEDGDEMGDNEESTDSRANDETDETSAVWPVPGLTHQLDRVVNIFAKEKLINVPIQSFKYYDTMGTFENKAGLNLRLILDRSGVAGLPADMPINVNVTVTVGKEEDDKKPEPKRRSPGGRDRDNLRTRKNGMKKRRDAKRGSKKGLQRGYILKVKEKYMKKQNNSNRWYVKAANSLLYKAELEKLMEDMKNNAIPLSSAGLSDTEQTTDDYVPEIHSQFTNCSTEDESCYTQTLKKVSHIYKVEVKPTQSLIEDDSEDFSVGTAPTPPVADKGTIVADAVLTCEGLTPPGRCLYRSDSV